MTIKSIVINGKTILSTPNAINEGVWFVTLRLRLSASCLTASSLSTVITPR